MINKRSGGMVGTRQELYSYALVETVKIGIRRFALSNGLTRRFGNVEVIIDGNEQNAHPMFDQIVNQARKSDDLFRSVTRITLLDSAASRMLQLADVVSHARAWIDKEQENAKKLKDVYKIEVL